MYKDILHFLNPNTALKKKIEQNGGFLLGTPGYSLCHHIALERRLSSNGDSNYDTLIYTHFRDYY